MDLERKASREVHEQTFNDSSRGENLREDLGVNETVSMLNGQLVA